MNANGSGQTQLTPPFQYNGNPTWSPDGSQIAFTTGRGVKPQIFVIGSGGGSGTNLSNNQVGDGSPAWRP